MSEKKLYARIKRYLPGTTSRVENLCDPGMPDVSGSCAQGDYWVELKDTGLVNPVAKPEDLLEPDQRAWTVKRLKKGAKVFLAIGYKRSMTLSRAVLVKNKLYYILVYCCKGPVRKERGLELTNAITRYLSVRGI